MGARCRQGAQQRLAPPSEASTATTTLREIKRQGKDGNESEMKLTLAA